MLGVEFTGKMLCSLAFSSEIMNEKQISTGKLGVKLISCNLVLICEYFGGTFTSELEETMENLDVTARGQYDLGNKPIAFSKF